MLRYFYSILLVLLVSAPVLGQEKPPPVPDAKPPTMEVVDESIEPQITITKKEGKTIEEHRVNGKLYKVIITPENGVPYTLVDKKGDGNFSQVHPDTPGSPGLSVPMWVIGTF